MSPANSNSNPSNPSAIFIPKPHRPSCVFQNHLEIALRDNFINKPYEKSCLEKIFIACWQIWNARNDCIFRHVKRHPVKILCSAAALCSSYWSNNPLLAKIAFVHLDIHWTPPPNDKVKINFDGYVRSSNRAALGFVIRNHHSGSLVAGISNVGTTSVPLTEGLAMKEALKIAKEKGFKHVLVEGDSKLIIDCVNGNCSTPWRLKAVIRDILHLRFSFEEILFTNVFREANSMADALANLGHSIEF